MINHFLIRPTVGQRLIGSAVVFALGVVGTGALRAEPKVADDLPRLTNAQITDLAGHSHALAGQTAAKLTVLVFLGTECPVSNGYLPALQRLSDRYASEGVLIFGVHCDPDVTAAVATEHAKEFNVRFPLALDHQQVLAAACGARIMPSAVAIGSDGQVVYRGRIDNRYSLTGVRRPEATVFDLRSAIDAVLAGRLPEPAATHVFGCPLPTVRLPNNRPSNSAKDAR